MKSKEQLKKLNVSITSIFLLLLIVFSCKNDSKDVINIEENINGKRTSSNGSIEFEFDFPDTIHIDKLYNGKIKYKGIFDTITTSFDDDKKSRYISFYMIKTRNKIYDIKKFYEMKLDTFGAIDNRTIPFYDIKFTELGVHYIDGIINDHVVIDTFTRPKKPVDKARYIEKVVQATHKVVVIK